LDRTIGGLFWLLLYLAIVLVPVFLMLVPPVPSGRGFWLEFSVALGFVGLTQIGLQFLLIARFKRVTAPYGIDIILRYHKQIALVAVGAILLHPIIIVIDYPARLKLLNPLGGNWASRFALISLLALLSIVATSVFRERIRLDYERWRVLHLGLGVSAIVFAQLHASMAGLYINTAWKQAIWIVMAAVMVGFVMYLRLFKPAWQQSNDWRVAEVRTERGDTHTLALEPAGHEGFRFQPGQFAWIKLDTPFTLEEHPFSFASSAERTDRIEFGIKALGDFQRRHRRRAARHTRVRGRAPRRLLRGPLPGTGIRPRRRRRRHHAVHVHPAHHGRPRRPAARSCCSTPTRSGRTWRTVRTSTSCAAG
jgi:predicted ferric reductase